MNCPHCQKELPSDYGATWCPFCGKNLPVSEINSVKPQLRRVKINWFIFYAVLLAPALITMLTAMCFHAPNQGVSAAMGLFGGGAAGIACGIMLGLRLGKTLPTRIVLGILFSFVLVVVCITLCCFGCQAGGYNLRID